MVYLWQNGNRYHCKSKHFSTYLLSMCFLAPCACIRKEWHITHVLYFDKNNLCSVDNTRYDNIFECIYHIVVYRDIFLQCRDIVIQKISYHGITTRKIISNTLKEKGI